MERARKAALAAELEALKNGGQLLHRHRRGRWVWYILQGRGDAVRREDLGDPRIRPDPHFYVDTLTPSRATVLDCPCYGRPSGRCPYPAPETAPARDSARNP